MHWYFNPHLKYLEKQVDAISAASLALKSDDPLVKNLQDEVGKLANFKPHIDHLKEMTEQVSRHLVEDAMLPSLKLSRPFFLGDEDDD
jgi:hypothetical protein